MSKGRKEDFETQKHTLSLFAGDFRELQDNYPDIGAAAIVRRLVRAHVDDLRKGGKTPKIKMEMNL